MNYSNKDMFWHHTPPHPSKTLKNPPGPCGLSRISSLHSLSSFGREVYLSLNLSPIAPSPRISLTLWPSPLSPNHIKRQARASKTPKTQSSHFVVFLFSFGFSYEYHAEPFGHLIVVGLSFVQKPYKTMTRESDCIWVVAHP